MVIFDEKTVLSTLLDTRFSGHVRGGFSVDQLFQVDWPIVLNGGVEAVINRRDFLQIVLQHLLAIAVADMTVHHAVRHQLRPGDAVSVALFRLDVVFNRVAVEGLRQVT